MTADLGPYVDDDGGVWVPRTVPYLEARRIAKEAVHEFDQRIEYEGKVDALMLGFVRVCQCEEVCELETRWNDETARDESTGDRTCYAPAWAFRIVERPRAWR